MEGLLIVFQIIILIFSAVVHEVSHGFMAEYLGDPTARLAGRLTLNPLKHLDPVGSFLVPLVLFLSQSGFMFGWAKPVPYNPMNLKNPERDGAFIALAGPVSNFLIAGGFSIVYHIIAAIGGGTSLLVTGELIKMIVLINIALGIFNLVPIPPLDGSKVLFGFVPGLSQVRASLERYGFFLVLLFVFFGFQFIVPLMQLIAHLFLGAGAV